jgi:hypothetical protein
MMERNQPDHLLGNQTVREWLQPALAQTPQRSLPEILKNAGRQRKHKPVAMAAALLIGLLLLSSLRLPPLARALASLPLIGDRYLQFLQGSGMDIAYQAGFVRELGSQVTDAGVTLTVLGACSDGTQTAVMFSLQPTADGSISDTWQAIADGRLRVDVSPQQQSGYSLQLDEEAGAVYGLLKAEPAGWIGRRMQLTVNLESSPSKWQLSFPVMVLNSQLVETIPIDQQIAYGDYLLTMESLVFAPTQTVLHYSIRGRGGQGYQPIDGQPGDGSLLPMGTNWELQLADGSNLARLGGNLNSRNGVSQGEADFMPTASRSLTVWFLGFDHDAGPAFSLPAVVGSAVAIGDGQLQLSDLQSDDQQLTAVFTWQGPGEILKMSADLTDQAGELHRGEIVAIDGNSETLSYTPPATDPQEFQIRLLLHDTERIQVYQLNK